MALSTETEALPLMLHHILTDSESDVGQSSFKEETIEKVMQELYKEIMAEPSPNAHSILLRCLSGGPGSGP
ncbi:hypothetical protein VNO80_17962 [Phaseolus coccineus]|uniref:Uncharacterized protein n=1 Tax=Phaseolus coccineus TaxID=3886 RepID=A0AAN9MDA5_PHACN